MSYSGHIDAAGEKKHTEPPAEIAPDQGVVHATVQHNAGRCRWVGIASLRSSFGRPWAKKIVGRHQALGNLFDLSDMHGGRGALAPNVSIDRCARDANGGPKGGLRKAFLRQKFG